MKARHRFFYFAALSFIAPSWGAAYGQLQVDTARYSAGIKVMVDTYMSAVKKKLPINGQEYLSYPFAISEGSPYFAANSPAPGTLVYDGIRYDCVMIMYDVVADEPVTYTDNNQNLVRIDKRFVSEFAIDGIRFLNLPAADGASAGYYQVLCGAAENAHPQTAPERDQRADTNRRKEPPVGSGRLVKCIRRICQRVCKRFHSGCRKTNRRSLLL